MSIAGARLGVDIGGTFTDVVLEQGGQRVSAKVLTTYAAPEDAIIEGMRRVCSKAGVPVSAIAQIIHGTTLATNALIERRGAKTALVTTEGFRDVIEMRTESRFDNITDAERSRVEHARRHPGRLRNRSGIDGLGHRNRYRRLAAEDTGPRGDEDPTEARSDRGSHHQHARACEEGRGRAACRRRFGRQERLSTVGSRGDRRRPVRRDVVIFVFVVDEEARRERLILERHDCRRYGIERSASIRQHGAPGLESAAQSRMIGGLPLGRHLAAQDGACAAMDCESEIVVGICVAGHGIHLSG